VCGARAHEGVCRVGQPGVLSCSGSGIQKEWLCGPRCSGCLAWAEQCATVARDGDLVRLDATESKQVDDVLARQALLGRVDDVDDVGTALAGAGYDVTDPRGNAGEQGITRSQPAPVLPLDTPDHPTLHSRSSAGASE
jgi:hypothetical protein